MRVFALVIFASMAASPSAAQITPLVTISVGGDPHYTLAHTIEISPDEGTFARSRGEIEARRWTATRTSEDRTWTITSADCPALRRVALSFGDLPPITVRPWALEEVPATLPIPPTMKDGFETRLSFRTVTADGSTADVDVRTGNAYRKWGHEAVSALLPCWGPLSP